MTAVRRVRCRPPALDLDVVRRLRLAAYGLLHNPDDAAAVLDLDALADAADLDVCAAIDWLIAQYPSLAINPLTERTRP